MFPIDNLYVINSDKFVYKTLSGEIYSGEQLTISPDTNISKLEKFNIYPTASQLIVLSLQNEKQKLILIFQEKANGKIELLFPEKVDWNRNYYYFKNLFFLEVPNLKLKEISQVKKTQLLALKEKYFQQQIDSNFLPQIQKSVLNPEAKVWEPKLLVPNVIPEKKLTIQFPSEQQVKEQLIKIGYEPEYDNISKITGDQARQIFNNLWQGSRGVFTDYYDINKGNFAAFMKGTRRSPASVTAIKNYLQQNWHQKQKQELIKNIVYYENPYLIDLITEQIKFIYFIDGDNVPFVLDDLKSFQENKSILLIFYLMKDTSSGYLEQELPYKVFVRYSLGTDTQAVDIKITMDASILNQQLMNKGHFNDLKLLFVTSDMFANELVKNFTEFKRESDVINPKKRNISTVLNILTGKWDMNTDVEILKRELLENNVGTEENILIEIFMHQGKKAVLKIIQTKSELSEIELIAIFKVFWKLGYKTFTEQNNINFGYFSAVLNGKMEINSEIRNALWKFTMELLSE